MTLRLGLALALLLLASTSWAGEWNRWRGPNGTGFVPASEPVPTTLPATPKVVSSTPVGEGFASPVTRAGRVIYMDNVGGKEVVHCVDANDLTREYWRSTLDDTFTDSQGPPGPRSTPQIDGDRVYALSCRGELQCLSLKDGKQLWRTSYTKDHGAVFIGEKGTAPGATRHGNNGSPLIDGRHLIACVGGTNGHGIVCFDKSDGRVVWHSQNDQAAYAPPIVATIAGIRQVIAFTCDGAIGLRRDTGELLWRVPVKTAYARHVALPIVSGNIVIVSSHQAGLIGIQLSKDGRGIKAETAWTSKEAAMNFASPVLVDGFLYGLGPARNIVCVEAATGRLAWSQNGWISTSADKAHASFLVMKGNILTLTDSGELILFKADPKACTEIARAQVCGVNWCNPAYANKHLLVRDGIKGKGELRSIRLID